MDQRPQPRYPFEFIRADAMTFPLDGFDAIHASPPCQGYSTGVSSASSKWVPTLGKDEPRLIDALRERFMGPACRREQFINCTDCGNLWCLLHEDHHDDCGCTGFETECGECGEFWDESYGEDACPYCGWLPVRPAFWVIENVAGARAFLRDPVMLCGGMFGLDIPRHRYFEMSFPILAPGHAPCSGIAKRAAERRGWDYRDMSVTGKGRNAGTSDRWRELLGIDWDTTQHELAEAIPPAYTEFIGRELMKAIGEGA